MEGTPPTARAGWPRALGLLAAASVPWVGSPLILIAVPFGLLTFFLPTGRPVAWLLAGLGLALVAVGDPGSGFWYVERGWALLLGGCFLAVTLRWPEGRFLARGLGAVFGAFCGMVLLFRVRPGEWQVVEWMVRDRMEMAMGAVFQMVRLSVEPEVIPPGLEAKAAEAVAFQGMVFPALLGLASLSALALAWWLHRRLGQSPREALGALKDFRFNDQLVWVLILGVVALVATSGALERVGINAMVFMGALYALRGVAVVLFVSGGVSFLGVLLFLLAFLLLAPFVIFGAMFIGLGDTWFDLRNRGPSSRPGV